MKKYEGSICQNKKEKPREEAVIQGGKNYKTNPTRLGMASPVHETQENQHEYGKFGKLSTIMSVFNTKFLLNVMWNRPDGRVSAD